jgi:hypothetical protein
LTGTTLASGVTASSLTSVGTLTGLTVTRTTSGDTGTFTNTSTTNQSANVNAVSDNSTAISLRVFGSAAGSYGMLAANSTALYTTATSLNLCADNASGVIKFSTGSSVPERMRLDSSGNLGLGTSSPSNKLHIAVAGLDISGGIAIDGSTMQGIRLQNTTNTNSSLGIWFGTNNVHWCGISGQRTDYTTTWGTDLRFYTHEDATSNLTYARERMRIDSSGNLGLGATPSAWNASHRAIQFLYNTSISSYSSTDGLTLTSNGYADTATTWKYLETYSSAQYQVGAGQHIWYTAPSGTAGNAITWSERMRITSGGEVLIGNTNGTEKLTVTGNIRASGVYVGNGSTGDWNKGFGGIKLTTTTSTPTGGQSGDFVFIY